MSFEKVLRLLFLVLVFSQDVASMQQLDVKGEILRRNGNSAFLSDLRDASAEDLKLASVLLGAQIRGVREDGSERYKRLARKIDYPIAYEWLDVAPNEPSVPGGIERSSIKSIIEVFVLENGAQTEDIDAELRRAMRHLVKHDIDRSHVIFDIKDRKIDSSFFFLVLTSSHMPLSKEQFLSILMQLVFDNFEQANFSVERDIVTSRSCLQIMYDLDRLFPDLTVVFNLPLYRFQDFLFVPVCKGRVAKNVVLRFSIQKCRQVKRLYLMTLFPIGGSAYISDKQLQALTSLNGFSIEDSVERCIVFSESFYVPPQMKQLVFRSQEHIDIEAQSTHLSIEEQIENEVDIPPLQSNLPAFSFHCILI